MWPDCLTAETTKFRPKLSLVDKRVIPYHFLRSTTQLFCPRRHRNSCETCHIFSSAPSSAPPGYLPLRPLFSHQEVHSQYSYSTSSKESAKTHPQEPLKSPSPPTTFLTYNWALSSNFILSTVLLPMCPLTYFWVQTRRQKTKNLRNFSHRNKLASENLASGNFRSVSSK